MPTKQATTVELAAPSDWSKGSSALQHNGFPMPSERLPDPDTLWPSFRDNVLRGDTDSLSSFPETVTASRTFSDSDPPAVAAAVPATCEDGIMGFGGSPLGGMCPPVASPKGGGTEASNIPNHESVLRSFVESGKGLGSNGSALDPKAGSSYQTTTKTYTLGKWSPETA